MSLTVEFQLHDSVETAAAGVGRALIANARAVEYAVGIVPVESVGQDGGCSPKCLPRGAFTPEILARGKNDNSAAWRGLVGGWIKFPLLWMQVRGLRVMEQGWVGGCILR